jgi:nucleotide-binding universal stress UspA family protein
MHEANSERQRVSQKLGTRSELKTIFVPVDFSVSSLKALDFAVALATRFKASIELRYVLDPMYSPGRFEAPRLRSVRTEAVKEATLKLAKLAKLAKARVKPHVPVRHRVLKGIAYSAIVEAAAKIKSDIIVMGSEGRTGMSRFLIGSVAEKVVRHAQSPVLIVRTKRE